MDGAGGVMDEVSELRTLVESLERRLQAKQVQLETAEAELRRVTRTDSLSGSLNRSAILQAVEEEIRRSSRYGRPFSVILFDLDHFKLVNDIHGREAGDEAIRRFSAICQSTFRSTDHVGRYGGEEFLALLPETAQPGGLEAAERVRSALAGERFAPGQGQGQARKAAFADSGDFTVTVSAGVVAWEGGLDSDRLLAGLDAALRKAKEKGRNRVEAGSFRARA